MPEHRSLLRGEMGWGNFTRRSQRLQHAKAMEPDRKAGFSTATRSAISAITIDPDTNTNET